MNTERGSADRFERTGLSEVWHLVLVPAAEDAAFWCSSAQVSPRAGPAPLQRRGDDAGSDSLNGKGDAPNKFTHF